jgi:hypothetical protein
MKEYISIVNNSKNLLEGQKKQFMGNYLYMTLAEIQEFISLC